MLSSKLFTLNRWQSSQDRLDERYFLITILAAVLLHVAGFYAWNMMPKVEVVDVPVYSLNIKLGDSDEMSPADMKAIQPNTENSTSVETTVSHLVRDQEEEKKENQARHQSVAATMDKAMANLNSKDAATAPTTSGSKAVVKGKFTVRSEGVNVAAPVLPVTARQYVRDDQAQNVADNGTGDNGTHDAEMVSHYEQLISAWIQKFKVYPDEARTEGMEGETVIRIRIDRHGNIRYYVLEHSTGYPVLDHAAIDMIRRANPVPAVPNDYPRGDLMEFLIPVSFHLQP
jgi:TonB family protein